jgi:4-amino-4-deoxy-L-arabinose transferase-like glycosyltransferase
MLLVAVAGVVFLTRLGATGLWDDDETFFAETAREMYDRGDLIVPTFNQALFAHKPPFMYWMMIGAYHVLGITEFAARLPSALFGIATVLLLWRLGRILYSPGVGFWAGIILATSLNFVVISRAATTDAELIFFCTLPIYLFVRGTATRQPSDDGACHRLRWGEGHTLHEPSRGAYALIYASMGAAVMVKGPIGVLLPTAVLGLHSLIRRTDSAPTPTLPQKGGGGTRLRERIAFLERIISPVHFARTAWQMRPLTAIGMVLVVAGPWFVVVALKTQGAFLEGFFGVHHFHRFTSAMDNHPGPVWFYLAAICIGFFPWIIFLLPSLIELRRRIREQTRWRPADILIVSWFVVWVGFFSLASTKFPHYVVPAYPALALFTACFIDRWTRHIEIYGLLARNAAWITLAAAGVTILVVAPMVSRVHLQGEPRLGLAGLPLILGAAACAWFTERRQVPRSLMTLTATAMAFFVAIFGVAAVQVDRHQNTARLAAEIQRRAPTGDVRIGTWHYFRPGMAYYCNNHIEQFADRQVAREFLLAGAGRRFLVTTETDYRQIADNLPAGIGVLMSSPWFLKSGETLVLLGAANTIEPSFSREAQPSAASESNDRRQ